MGRAGELAKLNKLRAREPSSTVFFATSTRASKPYACGWQGRSELPVRGSKLGPGVAAHPIRCQRRGTASHDRRRYVIVPLRLSFDSIVVPFWIPSHSSRGARCGWLACECALFYSPSRPISTSYPGRSKAPPRGAGRGHSLKVALPLRTRLGPPYPATISLRLAREERRHHSK